jgi:hypothetical protein
VKQTRIKRWAFGMIASMVLLMSCTPLPATWTAEAAGDSSSAMVSAYDLTTRGAWNGVYGRDGYADDIGMDRSQTFPDLPESHWVYGPLMNAASGQQE